MFQRCGTRSQYINTVLASQGIVDENPCCCTKFITINPSSSNFCICSAISYYTGREINVRCEDALYPRRFPWSCAISYVFLRTSNCLRTEEGQARRLQMSETLYIREVGSACGLWVILLFSVRAHMRLVGASENRRQMFSTIAVSKSPG